MRLLDGLQCARDNMGRPRRASLGTAQPGASAEQPAAGKLCKLTPLSSMRRRTGVPGSHVEALEVPGVILA